jgi:hypothetical protein
MPVSPIVISDLDNDMETPSSKTGGVRLTAIIKDKPKSPDQKPDSVPNSVPSEVQNQDIFESLEIPVPQQISDPQQTPHPKQLLDELKQLAGISAEELNQNENTLPKTPEKVEGNDVNATPIPEPLCQTLIIN